MPSGDKLTRDEKKAVTRSRLLEAAAVVFRSKGYAAASLDEIAEEAGLTKGAVYSNFSSKDDLIVALIDERLDRPEVAINAAIPHGGTQAEEAAQAAELFFKIFDSERETFLLGLELLLYEARHGRVGSLERYWEVRQAMAEAVEQRAAEHGRRLTMPAIDLVQGLFALGSGLALTRLREPEVIPDALFAQLVTAMVTGATAPAPEIEPCEIKHGETKRGGKRGQRH